MEIIEITDRDSLLIEQLLNIWESSVRATHLFLSAKEIDSIKQYVPRALREVPHLASVYKGKHAPSRVISAIFSVILSQRTSCTLPSSALQIAEIPAAGVYESKRR